MPALPACSVFIATSLDGFIAREDGRLDWLDAANACVPPGEDCGYGAFFASVDALVMGRATFETVLGFPEWPYADKPVWVVSRTLAALPAGLPPTVRLVRGTPREIVHDAAAAGWQRLYIDGGQLIRAFLQAGLITDMTLTTVPVLLGAGRPLFGAMAGDMALRLVETKGYAFGFVQSTYRLA